MNNGIDAVATIFVGWAAGLLVSWMTWYFSSRPRSFVRVFVPRAEWRQAISVIVRDPNWSSVMRKMALFQFLTIGLFCTFGSYFQLRQMEDPVMLHRGDAMLRLGQLGLGTLTLAGLIQ
jgi:hypothetical protein